ncbi:MAG: adenylate cyclase [Pseudomonadales bacterium]|nr:adenylate cyclase [Pseudomonadales bacterium]RLU03499.1 MAG: CYTH domain-containing protein [Ketobacter sp.]
MAVEIERKFLVANDDWRRLKDGSELSGIPFRQGYVPTEGMTTVRVRLEGDKAKLTIKGKNQGLSRAEFEYEIPLSDAEQMLDNLCARPLIEKTRYFRPEAGVTWEIDVFAGDNAGLVVAEVELQSEDQQLDLPNWLGQEVSDDPRYYNVNLVSNPYRNWR